MVNRRNGEIVVGEMDVGKMGVGETVVDEMVVGEMVVGEMVVGETVVGEMEGHRPNHAHVTARSRPAAAIEVLSTISPISGDGGWVVKMYHKYD
jgi:hypothetical protein